MGETDINTVIFQVIDKMSNVIIRMEREMDELEGRTKKLEGTLKGTNEQIGFMRGGFMNMITTGMFMSIGWQAINGVLTTMTGAIKEVIFANVEYEATMVSLQSVAMATGRSLEEVTDMINRQADELTDVASVQEATLRLMSTSLSTDQIEQFIVAVKNGSAAMGEMASEQLPLVASGFRRLNPNVLDNIGVNVRLDRIQRELAQTLGVSTDALTNAQIEQALYSEVIRQSTIFTGLYEKQSETAKGSMQKMSIEWEKLSRALSDTKGVKAASDAIAGLFEWIRKAIEAEKEYEEFLSWRAKKEQGMVTEPVKERKLPIVNITGLNLTEEYNMTKVAKSLNMTVEQLNATLKISSEAMKDFNLTQIGASIIGDKLILTERGQMLEEEKLGKSIKTTDEWLKDLNYNEKTFIDLAIDAGSSLTEWSNRQKELEKAIEDSENRIEDETIAIRNNKKELRDVNDELSTWKNRLRDAEKVADDLKATLERKMEVLFPEQFEETEERLQRILGDMESTRGEFEKAFEAFQGATSVKEQLKAKEEAEMLSEKYIGLAEEEKLTRQALLEEVAKLTEKLAQANTEVANAASNVAYYTKEQDRLNKLIEASQDIIDGFNDKIRTSKDELDDVIAKVIEFKDKVNELNTALGALRGKELVRINIEGYLPEGVKEWFGRGGYYQGYFKIDSEDIEGLQRGLAFVPENMLAMLHKGEMVMQAGESRELLGKRSLTQTNATTIIIGTLNTGSQAETKQFFGTIEEKIRNVVNV